MDLSTGISIPQCLEPGGTGGGNGGGNEAGPDDEKRYSLYFVPEKTGRKFKIGISNDVRARFRAIRNDCTSGLSIDFSRGIRFEGAAEEVRLMEAALHHRFREFCEPEPRGAGRTEWFSMVAFSAAVEFVAGQKTWLALSAPMDCTGCEPRRASKKRGARPPGARVCPDAEPKGIAQVRAYWVGLTLAQRLAFAQQCGTTVLYVHRALVRRRFGRKLAERIEAVTQAKITADMLCQWRPVNPLLDMRCAPEDRDSPGFASLRAFFNDLSKQGREKFAAACGTTVLYIRKTLVRGEMGPEMALKVEQASGRRITRDRLYPNWTNIWPDFVPPNGVTK